MNRHPWKLVPRLAFALALGAIVAGTTACMVGDPEVEYGGGGGAYSDYPPDDYIATADPYYYNGYASYYYGGRWYFRDGGGRWGHYNREPSGLRSRRMHAAPARHVYESRGRSSGGGTRFGGGRSNSGGGRHRR
jgi:hypothetical protein